MDIQILLVEDDEHICNAAKAFLENAGFIVDAFDDGLKAWEMFYNKTYQLVILDIMLPNISGLEILKEIRKHSDVPALIITALADDEHQLTAFSSHADDYITKPFAMIILLKRAEAILRRTGILKEEICVGDLSLFPIAYKATFQGEDILLTPKEFELLFMLVQNKDNIVLRERMLVQIWGYDFEGNERIVDTHIKNLRSKLPVNIIKTIKGIGYRLETE
ncbi:Regulatory protein VanRB [uncultured Eubacteriales bacterium]|uniref:Stage 0 sporulation protein A homolog n=1 Tax=uncultured Eubacteriales bacterium TaxID=172733 RepID=A0A212J533_9FIRM|nr:Regulatory protein VanRB [uncultured Eubacteriales bacterium]